MIAHLSVLALNIKLATQSKESNTSLYHSFSLSAKESLAKLIKPKLILSKAAASKVIN